MEDYKAYQAIAQIKQIVHDAGLCVANEIPCGSVLKRDLNRLEGLAYIVRAYYDATKDEAFAREVASVPRHVFPQIIKCKKLQSKTQASVARCHRMLYEIATHANEPQQNPVKPDTKPMGIDEKLAFIPQKHIGAAKATFAGLLNDGWIKNTPTGFEWIKNKTNALICYFADLANDKWELRNKDGNKSEWKQFAKLFNMEAKTFRNWKSDQRNHTGEVPPKNADKIKAYFK